MFELLFTRKYLTKEQKLLNVLLKNKNKFVSALELAKKSHSLHKNELLRRLRVKWYNIINYRKFVNWEVHSYYKLIENDDKINKD